MNSWVDSGAAEVSDTKANDIAWKWWPWNASTLQITQLQSLGIRAPQSWCMDWCCHLMWFPSKPFIKFMTVADLCYCVPLRGGKKKKAITQLSTAVHWKVMCDVKQGEGNHVHFTTDTRGEPVVKQLIKCHSIFDSLPGWQGSVLTSFKPGDWFKSHFLPALLHCQRCFTPMKIKAELAISCQQATHSFFMLLLPQNTRQDTAYGILLLY